MRISLRPAEPGRSSFRSPSRDRRTIAFRSWQLVAEPHRGNLASLHWRGCHAAV